MIVVVPLAVTAEDRTGKFWNRLRTGMSLGAIESDAIVAQIDAEFAVGIDRVFQDGVAGAGIARALADGDAVAAIERDEVAAPEMVPPIVFDVEPSPAKTPSLPLPSGAAAGCRADEVPLDHGLARRGKDEAVAVIAGDDIAGAGGCAANRVAGDIGDRHAVTVSAQGSVTAGSRTDPIPLNDVRIRLVVHDHVITGVPGDKVAVAAERATDGVSDGVIDIEATVAVCQRPVRRHWCP